MAPQQTSDMIVPEDELHQTQIISKEIKEILCDGYYYDVTNFIDRHPGGGIIDYYTDKREDATHAIQQFHQRSPKKIAAMLKSFKRRPANDRHEIVDKTMVTKHQALTEDFTKLYIELEKEGMFQPAYLHNIYRFFEMLAIGYIGYLFLFSASYFFKLFGCLLLGLAQGRSGWIQHEAGHQSLTGRPGLDRQLNAFVYGLFTGMSSKWWRGRHNRHHAMPQRLQHDFDFETLPLVAHAKEVVTQEKMAKGFLIQNQKFLFFSVDTFIGMLLFQLYVHPKYVLKHGLYMQGIWMAGHCVLAYQIGFLPWLISTWVLSVYLIGQFALSHTHLPLAQSATHWVEYCLSHTADIEHKPYIDWWMGYTNYQIEHHLFPTMPQLRHPVISGRVKALAEKHGLPYIVYSYPEAIRQTLNNLSRVSKELEEMQF